MNISIWEKCKKCKVNCCKQKISYRLFLTKQERDIFEDLNKIFPCKFLNKNGLCKIHKERPVDCRLFPFDIIKKNNDFLWIYWNTNCPITREGTKKEFESCLKDIEKKILPDFKDYIEAYSKYRLGEFINKFGSYIVLRPVKI